MTADISSLAERAALVAAADYPAAVLASRLEIVYSIVVLSVGTLIIGVVMWKGVFNRLTAGLGVATGVLGIVSLAGLGVTIILNAVGATVCVPLVGYGLFRIDLPPRRLRAWSGHR